MRATGPADPSPPGASSSPGATGARAQGADQGSVGGRLRHARRGVRNVDFGGLQETFLVAAVTMILIIRTQLWATNYPQLGGHGLHIAHLLYGGLFMVIAIGMLLTYLGRGVRHTGAIVGGIGFGFFIDEVGKFTTSDNNYFFKPAAALIYVTFIALFLINRRMVRRREFSPREYLCNAVEFLSEAARRDLDDHEKHRALELLGHAPPEDEVAAALRRLIEELDTITPRVPSRPARLVLAVRERYFQFIQRPGFERLVGVLFVAWAALTLLELVLLALYVPAGAHGFRYAGWEHLAHLSVTEIASGAVGVASAACVALGIYRLLRHRRPTAFAAFDIALLLQIYVGQVFSFVDSQFTAVFALGVDILLLVTLRYMIRRERQLERAQAAGAPPPGPVPAGTPEATPSAARASSGLAR